ncbi:VOC family protein [Halalkalibacter urbisdiaboli]|uniref:VOC family protein n=1 Tax=Halalkalibacter urbisdiaboli TaxID=1960589 RepID=UPI000B434567|nr:VOC family protein [Halalkalibacter urbisdiaboli]
MKSKISLITIVTDDVLKMKNFYREVIGFNIEGDSEQNVEFESEGVRFSICSRQIMSDITGGHPSFKEGKMGQSFELAFPCDTPEEVENSYKEIIQKGAVPIKEPTQMPWGQTTAFFADPDGNIHEIFC